MLIRQHVIFKQWRERSAFTFVVRQHSINYRLTILNRCPNCAPAYLSSGISVPGGAGGGCVVVGHGLASFVKKGVRGDDCSVVEYESS
jgi:hypothetical protein